MKPAFIKFLVVTLFIGGGIGELIYALSGSPKSGGAGTSAEQERLFSLLDISLNCWFRHFDFLPDGINEPFYE